MHMSMTALDLQFMTTQNCTQFFPPICPEQFIGGCLSVIWQPRCQLALRLCWEFLGIS